MSTYTATDFDTTDCFQVYDQNELDFVCSHIRIAPKVGVNPGNYSLNAAVRILQYLILMLVLTHDFG